MLVAFASLVSAPEISDIKTHKRFMDNGIKTKSVFLNLPFVCAASVTVKQNRMMCVS